MGKLLIIFGLIIVVIGVVVYFSDRFPSIGKLPGDIVIKRDNFTFYFPLATSIILSVIISLIFYLIKKFG
ncbi:uncharacterized protein HemY [Catalinimonas alkaloidigena]|uniref:DUF2905 domain-containing protein n=1 Tax=Catalinimonas alkaloidigena TaxID=1075417 RepID=UPI0024070EE9|nr:DUF2905 domain-containing protein [Catalinimonas alkaloidigena]MDF9800923.1 uncharacterized protein HemY [Catalinimonas alkaloidigena]